MFLQKLWTNFEKSKNQIFSKTTRPILMAKIYVIGGTKEVLKNSITHSVYNKGIKKIIQIFK